VFPCEALSSERNALLPLTQAEGDEVDTVTSPEIAKAVKNNSVCVAALTTVCQEENMLLILLSAMTEDCPDSLAHLIVKGLEKKFTPKDQASQVEFYHELDGLTMKKGGSPEDMFTKLVNLRVRFGKGVATNNALKFPKPLLYVLWNTSKSLQENNCAEEMTTHWS
jgi:hypothetical protein